MPEKSGSEAGMMADGKISPLARKHAETEADVQQTGAAGAALVLSLFGPGGAIVLDRVAERLGLSKQQLAETMGVSPETVYRADRSRARRTQARAAEMLEIIGRISTWAGGERQALAWYRAEPLPAFGGRTAESLVKDGKAAAVRDFLDHVATGGFA